MPGESESELIARVAPGERARTFATLTSAFTDDPVERWLWPGDRAYERHFPEFVEAFGGAALDAGTVWRVGDFDAVALWLPPGAEPDGDAIVAVLAGSLPDPVLADALPVLAQVDAAHPREPHWYLPWLGVTRTITPASASATSLEAREPPRTAPPADRRWRGAGRPSPQVPQPPSTSATTPRSHATARSGEIPWALARSRFSLASRSSCNRWW